MNNNINMEEFVKNNRKHLEELEARGATHDFCPYDAIKYAADLLVGVEVFPFDEVGVNYVVKWNGLEGVIGILNRSDLPHEMYALMRISNFILSMVSHKEV